MPEDFFQLINFRRAGSRSPVCCYRDWFPLWGRKVPFNTEVIPPHYIFTFFLQAGYIESKPCQTRNR